MKPLDPFTRAYVECALWSSLDQSTESGGYPLDKNHGPEDIAPETLARMAEDCRQFQADNAADLSESELSDSRAGSWRRVSSVTPGGKSFFWLGKFPGRTLALVWDRSAEGWRMHYGPNYDLRGGRVFPGIAEAKRDAQQFALGYPLQPYERA